MINIKILGYLLISFTICSKIVNSQTTDTNNEVKDDDSLVFSISDDIKSSGTHQELLNKIKTWITSGSKLLHKMTNGKSRLPNKVKILIPPSWLTEGGLNSNPTNIYSHNRANLRLEPRSGVCNSFPRTIQTSNVCGKRGEYIHVPLRFLNSADTSQQDRVFALEWIKYYYGVFDNFGCPKDDKFPAFYLNNQQVNIPNLNYDKIPIGTPKNVDNQKTCNKLPSGKFEPSCYFQLNHDGSNDNITSHFTSMPTLKNNINLATSSNHNKNPLTPQNFFCCGRSISSMINDYGPPLPEPPSQYKPPTFEVIHQNIPKVVVVLDTSNSMKYRVHMLDHALENWILNLGDGSIELAIVQFGQNANVLRSRRSIDANYKNFARHLSLRAHGDTNIASGIRLGLQELENDGGIMVLFSDGENTDSNYHPNSTWFDATKDEILRSKAKVITIAFGNAADSRLEEVAEMTQGSSFFAETNSAGIADITEFLSKTLDYSASLPILSKFVTLLKLNLGSRSSRFSSSFVVDDTSGLNTKLTVNSVSKKSIARICVQVQHRWRCEDAGEHSVSIEFSSLHPGTYGFYIDMRRRSELYLEVKSKAKNTNIIHGSCEAKTVQLEDGNNVVVIYGKLMSGYYPVLNGRIKAHVKTDGTHVVHTLNLLDNGLAMDKQKNDGIYSRSFTQFDNRLSGKIRYKVSCEFEGDKKSYILDHGINSKMNTFPCCESRVSYPKPKTFITSKFKRISSGGSFQVHLEQNKDKIPPATIQDLKLESIDGNTGNIKLSFTSMGDDSEFGTATEYKIRYSTSLKDLFYNFNTQTELTSDDIIQGGSLSPVPGGTKFSVVIPGKFQNYHFAVQLIDDAGLTSKTCKSPYNCQMTNTICFSSDKSKSKTLNCVDDEKTCKSSCEDNKDCSHYSYNKMLKICRLLEGSNDEVTCQFNGYGFTSFSKICNDDCNKNHYKIGDKPLATYKCIPNYHECQKVCNSEICNYFSYTKDTEECHLHDKVTQIIKDDGSIHGNKNCYGNPDPKFF